MSSVVYFAILQSYQVMGRHCSRAISFLSCGVSCRETARSSIASASVSVAVAVSPPRPSLPPRWVVVFAVAAVPAVVAVLLSRAIIAVMLSLHRGFSLGSFPVAVPAVAIVPSAVGSLAAITPYRCACVGSVWARAVPAFAKDTLSSLRAVPSLGSGERAQVR